MSINLSNAVDRTIEIRPALIHVTGKQAGWVEVPILLRNRDYRDCDLDELYLEIDGEETPLEPLRREFFDGQLRLMFFSPILKQSGQLPREIQLYWGCHSSSEEDRCGMALSFREAPGS